MVLVVNCTILPNHKASTLQKGFTGSTCRPGNVSELIKPNKR